MKKLAVAVIVAAVFVYGLWFIAVPKSLLSGLITDSFQGSSVGIDTVNFQKGPFYDVSIGQLKVEKSGSTILSVDNLDGRFSFSSLLKLSPGIIFHGDVAGGTIHGTVYFSKGGRRIDAVLEGAHLEDVPFLTKAGIDGKGIVSGKYRADNSKGSLEFTVDSADIKPYSFGGVPVPLNMFQKARGSMETDGRMLKIVSFTMEGKGIYARIKGSVNGRMMNLTLEIMPDASLERQNPMFSMIRQYEVSPGHYSIPLRSTLPF